MTPNVQPCRMGYCVLTSCRAFVMSSRETLGQKPYPLLRASPGSSPTAAAPMAAVLVSLGGDQTVDFLQDMVGAAPVAR